MPDTLIAIPTCHNYLERARMQQETWVKDNTGWADVRFFFGRGEHPNPRPDEVTLDVPDDYLGLPEKVRATFAWALGHGYKHAFKADDDTFIYMDKLAQTDYRSHDYVGRKRVPSNGYPAHYPSGGPGYWLNEKTMRIVAEAPLTEDWAEDRWVANVLHQHGIECQFDDRYVFTWLKRPWGNPQSAATVCFVDLSLSVTTFPDTPSGSLRRFFNMLVETRKNIPPITPPPEPVPGSGRPEAVTNVTLPPPVPRPRY